MRLTEEQYADLMRARQKPQAVKPKRTKFRNIRCQSADGKNFASQLERDYYEQLLLRWKAGEVQWIIRQPSFDLEGGIVYRADFLICHKDGQVSVVDTKGFLTRESANKIKQLKARYGIEVELVRKAKGRSKSALSTRTRGLPDDFSVRPIYHKETS